MDPQHDIEKKRMLIWDYIDLDDTELYGDEEAKNILIHLYKCLESSSHC